MLTKEQIKLITDCTSNILGFVKKQTVLEYKHEVNNKTLLQIITPASVITVDTNITPSKNPAEIYKLDNPSTWTKASKGLILPYNTDVTKDIANAAMGIAEGEAVAFDSMINTLSFVPISSLKTEDEAYPKYAVADSPNSAYWVFDSNNIERTHNATSLSGVFVKLTKDTINFINKLAEYNNVIDGVCLDKIGRYTALRFVSKSLGMTITLVGGSQNTEETVLINEKQYIFKTDLTFERNEPMKVDLKASLPALDPVDFNKETTKSEENKEIDKVVERKIVMNAEGEVIQGNPTFQDCNTQLNSEDVDKDESNKDSFVSFDELSDDILASIETLKTKKKEELETLKNITIAVKKIKKLHKSEVKEAGSNVKQIEEFDKMKNTLKKIQGLFDI